MDTAEAQRIVSDAVKARGYWDGLTPGEIAARQTAKLVEELDEYTAYLDMPYTFDNYIMAAGDEARRTFDDVERWVDCGPALPRATAPARRKELADMMVVLLNLAQAEAEVTGEPFDVIEAAVGKAQADISRGVRNPASQEQGDANSSQG